LLPMHIDSFQSMCLRAVLQLPREAVHVPPEFVERAERRRIESHEEVPDVRSLLIRVHLESCRRAAEHAAEDVNHEGQPISLVASEFLAGAARLMGLVPRIEVLPNVGTTSGPAFVVLIPIRLCSRAMRL